MLVIRGAYIRGGSYSGGAYIRDFTVFFAGEKTAYFRKNEAQKPSTTVFPKVILALGCLICLRHLSYFFLLMLKNPQLSTKL